MPRRKNTVLNGQARGMVYSVYCFIKNNDELGSNRNMMEIYKQTAEATSTSIATVRRIVKQVKDSEFMVIFRTPGKKRPRVHPITDVDSFDQEVIKRCIHSTNKEMPTIAKLRQKLREEINFQGSERSLRRIITKLGFKWRKTENNKKMLVHNDDDYYDDDDDDGDDDDDDENHEDIDNEKPTHQVQSTTKFEATFVLENTLQI
ncbi:hypothetical protein O3G_MSEX005705 [Manduca sexta]|uniref:Transposase n=1 Tax=Manduca sexta TaxID=7130 RepID=A0A922CK35_MANSE|nr:hypothetical protein O3G_MSEX005705 [Manduca sexta]